MTLPDGITPERVAAIICEAGRLAMADWRRAGTSLVHWEKQPGDPVSECDIAIDRFLRTELEACAPGTGWLSEETADDPARLGRDWTWVADPIDGTRDFVRGRDGWAISLALIHRGEPVLALLHAPARGELFEAQAGQGARLNGARLVASRRATLAGARIPADRLPRGDSDLLLVPKPNSIALRIAMVAADRADLLATLRWGHEWDIAAATLIAQEAGATASDALGRPLSYNKADPRALGVLVSSGALHSAALARLAERVAGAGSGS